MEEVELYSEYNNVSREIITYSIECKRIESEKQKSPRIHTTPVSTDSDLSNSINEEDLIIKPMMWTKSVENIIKEWYLGSSIKSHKHARSNIKFNRMFNFLSIINIIIPLISVFILSLTDCNDVFYLSTLLLSSIVSSIVIFIDPSKKANEHKHYMNKYNELINDINSELVKPLFYRISAELFMQKTLHRYNHLNSIAPVVD